MKEMKGGGIKERGEGRGRQGEGQDTRLYINTDRVWGSANLEKQEVVKGRV